jgi:hypothetical protein
MKFEAFFFQIVRGLLVSYLSESFFFSSFLLPSFFLPLVVMIQDCHATNTDHEISRS